MISWADPLRDHPVVLFSEIFWSQDDNNLREDRVKSQYMFVKLLRVQQQLLNIYEHVLPNCQMCVIPRVGLLSTVVFFELFLVRICLGGSKF